MFDAPRSKEADPIAWIEACNALTTLEDMNVVVNTAGQKVFMPRMSRQELRLLELAQYHLGKAIERIAKVVDKQEAV